jgi:hypothetical protein
MEGCSFLGSWFSAVEIFFPHHFEHWCTILHWLRVSFFVSLHWNYTCFYGGVQMSWQWCLWLWSGGSLHSWFWMLCRCIVSVVSVAIEWRQSPLLLCFVQMCWSVVYMAVELRLSPCSAVVVHTTLPAPTKITVALKEEQQQQQLICQEPMKHSAS